VSRFKTPLLYVMAVFYLVAGHMHFFNPDFYLRIMPPWIPWHTELVYLSGLAEIIVGIGLVLPQTRVAAAWATIALLIAVYPANLYVAAENVPVGDASEGAGAVGLVRLPFQLVFIAWAWWYTRDDTGAEA